MLHVTMDNEGNPITMDNEESIGFPSLSIVTLLRQDPLDS